MLSSNLDDKREPQNKPLTLEERHSLSIEIARKKRESMPAALFIPKSTARKFSTDIDTTKRLKQVRKRRTFKSRGKLVHPRSYPITYESTTREQVLTAVKILRETVSAVKEGGDICEDKRENGVGPSMPKLDDPNEFSDDDDKIATEDPIDMTLTNVSGSYLPMDSESVTNFHDKVENATSSSEPALNECEASTTAIDNLLSNRWDYQNSKSSEVLRVSNHPVTTQSAENTLLNNAVYDIYHWSVMQSSLCPTNATEYYTQIPVFEHGHNFINNNILSNVNNISDSTDFTLKPGASTNLTNVTYHDPTFGNDQRTDRKIYCNALVQQSSLPIKVEPNDDMSSFETSLLETESYGTLVANEESSTSHVPNSGSSPTQLSTYFVFPPATNLRTISKPRNRNRYEEPIRSRAGRMTTTSWDVKRTNVDNLGTISKPRNRNRSTKLKSRLSKPSLPFPMTSIEDSQTIQNFLARRQNEGFNMPMQSNDRTINGTFRNNDLPNGNLVYQQDEICSFEQSNLGNQVESISINEATANYGRWYRDPQLCEHPYCPQYNYQSGESGIPMELYHPEAFRYAATTNHLPQTQARHFSYSDPLNNYHNQQRLNSFPPATAPTPQAWDLRFRPKPPQLIHSNPPQLIHPNELRNQWYPVQDSYYSQNSPPAYEVSQRLLPDSFAPISAESGNHHIGQSSYIEQQHSSYMPLHSAVLQQSHLQFPTFSESYNPYFLRTTIMPGSIYHGESGFFPQQNISNSLQQLMVGTGRLQSY